MIDESTHDGQHRDSKIDSDFCNSLPSQQKQTLCRHLFLTRSLMAGGCLIEDFWPPAQFGRLISLLVVHTLINAQAFSLHRLLLAVVAANLKLRHQLAVPR